MVNIANMTGESIYEELPCSACSFGHHFDVVQSLQIENENRQQTTIDVLRIMLSER